MEKNIFYHDQEGRFVQVLSQAVMRENGRAVVLYQELFGSYERKVEYRDVFLGSMAVFNGEFPQAGEPVSSIKESPKAGQNLESSGFSGAEMGRAAEGTPDMEKTTGMEGGSPQDMLMAFLDAQSHSEKLEILYQMKDCVTDYLIDTMALSLDMEIPQGVLEDRYQKLIRSLRTVMKYESNRLR